MPYSLLSTKHWQAAKISVQTYTESTPGLTVQQEAVICLFLLFPGRLVKPCLTSLQNGLPNLTKSRANIPAPSAENLYAVLTVVWGRFGDAPIFPIVAPA